MPHPWIPEFGGKPYRDSCKNMAYMLAGLSDIRQLPTGPVRNHWCRDHVNWRPEQWAYFSIHTRVMQCGWKHSGKFALLFSALIILSILIPYTFALIAGNVRPLLPLIRQNDSDITQSGICSVALYIIAVIGLIIVAAFPVNIDLGKQELWDPSVLVPPLMGAFFAFFFGALYMLFQTAISLFFYEGNGRIVMFRFILFMVCSICFATSTLSTMFGNKKTTSDNIYIQTDAMMKFVMEPNVLSSLCEWLMVLFFAVYFLTFVRESESISVAITFRHLITGRRISLASLTNMSKI
ncbi:hypothetical protein AVEN_20999-1 [Araneus ventricosus]|uniref:CWH43-like N-terminal domain-containing protein n=1 Tax=Araneus ventricosus TaxID=182803 RepID=A0A4Y2D881_ARAVE|nr:hypothetical protein AVEN_20999-1 [Araneus ventricosus]